MRDRKGRVAEVPAKEAELPKEVADKVTEKVAKPLNVATRLLLSPSSSYSPRRCLLEPVTICSFASPTAHERPRVHISTTMMMGHNGGK